MCPSLIQIGSKTAEKNSAQTNRQTDRHYENNGHSAVNQHWPGRVDHERRVALFTVYSRHLKDGFPPPKNTKNIPPKKIGDAIRDVYYTAKCLPCLSKIVQSQGE